MEKIKNAVATPLKEGKTPPELPVLTVEAVKQMLKVDLNCCILMLQGIHDDPDTFDSLATVLHGKYMNAKHKEELDKQTKLKI